MKETLLEIIDQLVDVIYSVDQKGLDLKFIEFLDGIEQYIQSNKIELNQELLMLQTAYINKDLVQLADILLYEIKEKL